jgi:hypothetical protein
MKNPGWISPMFYIAALYDGVLGLAFLFAAPALFQWFGVTPPNHFGYVQFPGALLIVFALLFMTVASNPAVNRNLIPFGMLLKVSYCGVVFYHWIAAGIPGMWKPFAWIDLVFLAAFIAAYVQLRPQEKESS